MPKSLQRVVSELHLLSLYNGIFAVGYAEITYLNVFIILQCKNSNSFGNLTIITYNK